MERTLRYILISLCGLFFGGSCLAADKTAASDIKTFNGILVDVDVVEPVVSLVSDTHKGFSVSAEADFKHKFLPMIQIGYAKYDATDDYSNYIEQPDDYCYKVSGPYFKVGLDFNIISSDPVAGPFRPYGYLGVRFACSAYNFEVHNSVVNSAYWNDKLSYSISDNVFAHWGEFAFGVKVPVHNRLYLGLEGTYKFSFSPKIKDLTADDGVTVVRINQTYSPGYGDDNGSSWGFRYMISFLF